MAEQKQKSDLSRAFKEDGELKTHVGGQALLEGIMMRGKYNWSVAVREPEGTIYLEEHDLASGKDKNGWLYWPFVRGCRAFVESLMLGYKALSIAAEHAFVEEDEEEGASASKQSAADAGEIRTEPAADAGELQLADQGDIGGREAGTATPGAAGDGELQASAPGASASRARATDESRREAPAPGIQSDMSEPAELAASEAAGDAASFSWKRDFGNPDEMIDGLGAQRTLEVVDGDTGLPVRAQFDEAGEGPADHNLVEEALAAPVAIDPALDEGAAPEKKPLLGDKEMALSMVLGLVLGVVLFIVAPAAITNFIVGEYDDNTLAWNIVDGILRIAVFVFYIWLIGRMSDIKRMFGYHGAEHKTIHCFEHGLPLTPENARSFPRLHVRCGTAFLIMVMIIAIFVYTVTPINALIEAWGVPDGPAKLALVIAVRIILMPVIAGISYEITVKWAGSHPSNPLVKVILWPGMQMQYLTTREPDDGQIECAIAAMKLVLEREEREAAAAGA